MISRIHNAHYGDVVLLRGYCSECRSYAVIIDGEIKCCGARLKSTPEPQGFKQMCEQAGRRKRPPKRDQEAILKDQQHCCFYCGRRFGKIVWRRAQSLALRIEWDHKLPYCYSRSNLTSNFVAACHVCNRLKASHVFTSFDAVEVFLYDRWKVKGYSDVPVRHEVPPETQMAKVL